MNKYIKLCNKLIDNLIGFNIRHLSCSIVNNLVNECVSEYPQNCAEILIDNSRRDLIRESLGKSIKCTHSTNQKELLLKELSK